MDHLKIKGWLIIQQIKDNKIIKEDTFDNLVVNSGLSYVAGLMGGFQSAPFKYIAIGLGDTPATETDTSLDNEYVRSEADNIELVTTEAENDTLQLTKTWAFTSRKAICEAGVFNEEGVMLSRRVFSACNIENGINLRIIWRIQCK